LLYVPLSAVVLLFKAAYARCHAAITLSFAMHICSGLVLPVTFGDVFDTYVAAIMFAFVLST